MQILNIFSNVIYYTRLQLLNIIVGMYTVSCIYNLNVDMNHKNDILYLWNKHRQLISTIQHYQIQGNIIYTIDSDKKTYINFFWIKHDNHHYTIKLLNIFGLTIMSIYIKNGMLYIIPNIMYRNNDSVDIIQNWFNQTNFFEEQLQKWIIGLPGNNTKYNLNDFGYLSDMNYCIYNENISIFYRCYHIDDIQMLPKILEIHYKQYFVKLHINRWSL